jgi:membrane-bound serine protease (ClpP class)
MYASHFAVMAPATNIGAATPVQMGGFPGSPSEPDDKSGDKKPAPDNQHAMENKAINDSVAYIRGLAELRGRNADWAELAVREAASLSGNEALKLGVIDFIANDLSELLMKLNGKQTAILGRNVTLNTEAMVLEEISPDWRSRLLSIITDPNIAYILMLIGIYGLIFEFSNPGAVIPGVAGAICLLIALYAFQVLPVNYAGLGLILLGVTLMVAEAFAPSFGALGIGGIIAFVIGSVILMNTDVPGFGVSLPLIATFALLSSVLFTIVLYMAIKARNKPVVSGREELLGAMAEVLADFSRHGRVRVHSEIWNAVTDHPLLKGQQVRVTRMDGLTLSVEPVTGQSDTDKTTGE